MEWDIHWYDTLESTNTHLRTQAAEFAAGTVIATLEQTAGRGRLSRTWSSGSGRNLTFSILLRETVAREQMPSLSMAAALGVAAFLKIEFGLEGRVKWPNDVRVGDRKICGILAELAESDGDAQVVVLGIGVNVNMSAAALESIEPPATSILYETGEEHDVAQCLSRLLRHLERRFGTWRASGFDGLRREWVSLCDFVDEAVSIQENGSVRQRGVLRDFDSRGALILEDEDGSRHTVMAGDVSLRRG